MTASGEYYCVISLLEKRNKKSVATVNDAILCQLSVSLTS